MGRFAGILALLLISRAGYCAEYHFSIESDEKRPRPINSDVRPIDTSALKKIASPASPLPPPVIPGISESELISQFLNLPIQATEAEEKIAQIHRLLDPVFYARARNKSGDESGERIMARVRFAGDALKRIGYPKEYLEVAYKSYEAEIARDIESLKRIKREQQEENYKDLEAKLGTKFNGDHEQKYEMYRRYDNLLKLPPGDATYLESARELARLLPPRAQAKLLELPELPPASKYFFGLEARLPGGVKPKVLPVTQVAQAIFREPVKAQGRWDIWRQAIDSIEKALGVNDAELMLIAGFDTNPEKPDFSFRTSASSILYYNKYALRDGSISRVKSALQQVNPAGAIEFEQFLENWTRTPQPPQVGHAVPPQRGHQK